MVNKYFNVDVKPVMPVATQIQSNKTDLVFGAGDVLFGWTAFEVPKGSSKLIDMSVMIRGAQTVKDIEFFFAKTYNGEAPGSIGTGNTDADGTGYYKNMLGAIVLDSADVKEILNNMVIGSLGHGAGANQITNLVLTGEPESGSSVGHDKLYIAAAVKAGSGWNFSTGVLADGAVTLGAASDFDVKTVVATNFFDVGDVVHVHDSDTAIGTVKSLTGTNIVLEAATGVAIADEDEIINASPISISLCFEK